MSGKRFVSVAEYQRTTGLSYPTVMSGIERGDIRAIKTEAGHWRVDTQADGNPDMGAIVEQLEDQGRLLRALCGHLGVSQ